MPTRYFRLSQDVRPGYWDFRIPTDLQGKEVDDPWMFMAGHPVPGMGRLKLSIDVPGKPLDFTLGGIATPVVHARVASIFQELAPEDVQVIPAEVQGHADSYCILVATRLLRCIDDKACEEVLIWTPEAGRPDKVGQYRDIWGMRIDPALVGDAKVFRTWGWSVALIVREDIKEALERIGATGTKFTAV